MRLPENGLIVSCYMHSMRQATPYLIETLWEIPEVKTLRIEGEENLGLALRLKDIEDKYVIGLIKTKDTSKPYITPTVDYIKRVCDLGVDMVAVDCRYITVRGTEQKGEVCDLICSTTTPVMADIEYEVEAKTAWTCGVDVVSTTFTERDFKLAMLLSNDGIPTNIEGGLVRDFEIAAAQNCGARWYTIGRAIHDPITNIQKILKLGDSVNVRAN